MTDLRQPEKADYTAQDLRRRAAGLLMPTDVVTASLRGLLDAEMRPAAVLIPIIDRAPEATVLLTVRTERLPVHASQISFPGGKMDADDATPAETAFREAEEEIGLSRANVELIGFLNCHRTYKGFCIAPAVGLVAPNFDLKLDRREVAEVFEVPLRFLMTPGNHEWHPQAVNGERRDYYAMPYQGRHIWGVTAGIMRSLYERIYCA